MTPTTRSLTQLRHSIVGKLGSFWSRQINNSDKHKATVVADTAALPGRAAVADIPAVFVSGGGEVLVEDVAVPFTDGRFAYTGPRMGTGSLGFDGDVFLEVGAAVDIVTDPLWADTGTPALFAQDFVASDPEITYLVPVPDDIDPITILTADGGVLVSWVDFEPRAGYIVLRESPSLLFGAQNITIRSGVRRIAAPHDFLLDSDSGYFGNACMAKLSRHTQSPPVLARAAAEYCGLWVAQVDDFCLRAEPMPAGGMTYIMAIAGVVVIPWTHPEFAQGTEIPQGTIVGGRIDVLHGPTAFSQLAGDPRTTNDTQVPLKHAMPVADDLYFKIKTPVSVDVKLDMGTPVLVDGHMLARLGVYGVDNTAGTGTDVEAMYALQDAEAARTGVFLWNALFVGSTYPRTVDFGDILQRFYGEQCSIFTYSDLPEDKSAKLLQFIEEFKPVGDVTFVVSL